jgi:hypothetical protein
MAITSAATDNHLANATSTGFTLSTDPCSIAVWINAVWSVAGAGSFVGLYGPTPTPTTAIQIGRRASSLSIWTWGGGVLVSAPSGTMTDNVWSHVTYTFDGTTHRAYVNGVLINSTTAVQLAGQFTTVYINGYPTSITGEVSACDVDSYAYYDRALTADEILTMSSSKGARHGIVYGQIAAYEFDEGSAGVAVSSAVDMTGNGNHLTALGAGATPVAYSYNGTVASSNIRRVH